MIKINDQGLKVEDVSGFSTVFETLSQQAAPSFETEVPDLDSIVSQAEEYSGITHMVIIGSGGSRTSSFAFFHALSDFRNDVQAFFVSGADPDELRAIREQCPHDSTLIVIVSKSGSNINALEPLFLLDGYRVVAVTQTDLDGVLKVIAEKMEWDVVHHPNVGGRFSGLTSCALFPAALMGLPIKEIYDGAKEAYQKYNYQQSIEDNPCLKLAAQFIALDQKNYSEIFTAVYSSRLVAVLPLVIQLLHESTGKDGKGQTIFGDQAPESQHHTNQRFFGERTNVIGMLWGIEEAYDDLTLSMPPAVGDVEYSGEHLTALNGLSAVDTLKFDREAVLEHAIESNIPAVELLVSKVTPKSIGEFIVFWQYFAVYSSLLLDVDPFNQPHVEGAKKIGFEKRLSRD